MTNKEIYESYLKALAAKASIPSTWTLKPVKFIEEVKQYFFESTDENLVDEPPHFKDIPKYSILYNAWDEIKDAKSFFEFCKLDNDDLYCIAGLTIDLAFDRGAIPHDELPPEGEDEGYYLYWLSLVTPFTGELYKWFLDDKTKPLWEYDGDA